MIRRLVALALGAFLLHLNAQRADVACAQHDGSQRGSTHSTQSSTHGTHTAAMHEAAAASGQAAASETQNCETPVQPACCEAVVTCSIALGLDDAHRVSDAVALQDAIVLVAQSQPASRIAEPEPPPPKA